MVLLRAQESSTSSSSRWPDASDMSSSLSLIAVGHLEPVQLLFDLVKGVVADLVASRAWRGPPDVPRAARRGEARVCCATALATGSVRRLIGARCALNSWRTTSAAADGSCRPGSPARPRSARSRAARRSRPTGSSSRRSSARSSGFSVSPWMTSVPSTTQNAVSTIRSRYGKPAGSASAAASVTMPRMPAQAMTRPLPTVGRSIGRGGWKPNRRSRQRITALKDMCQAKRTTITVTSTAPATTR